MCHEWWERRRREAEESQELWSDFARTTPVSEPAPPGEAIEREPAEARETVTAPER